MKGYAFGATLLACLSMEGVVRAGQDEVFVTAGGVRVPTPPVASLDCARMLQVLTVIDGSNYRGVGAQPGDAADGALLSYENRLARRYYAECVSGPTSLGAATAAFSHGFLDDGAGGAAGR